MPHTRLSILFDRYLSKTCTEAERQELAELILAKEHEEAVAELMEKTWVATDAEMDMPEEKSAHIFNSILERDKKDIPVQQSKVISLNWSKVAIAASIILTLGIGSYFAFFNKTEKQTVIVQNPPANDVNPGSYKARLTLADGSTITLDSAALGELAKQGNTLVINKDGQLVYESGLGSHESVVYNTITTAKGETYTMNLADGSKVWLNSGSSIHFPVAFPGKERRIETTGEVFIKVAKNPAQPFIVSVSPPSGELEGALEVLALGTEFNINSYSDEDNISTTLIEGSVKVIKGESATTLKPGQQTVLNSNGQLGVATAVNIDEITAWKDGWFRFETADLKTILRQFARWYDIEVIYEGPVKNRKFFTAVKRSSTLKNVLEMLQDNNIIYRIEGKKLYVTSG